MIEDLSGRDGYVASESLADGWFCYVFEVPRGTSAKYTFSVGRRYSDEYNEKAGLPGLGAHSTDNQEYASIADAREAALRFFARVQQQPGYPYPDKMGFSSI